MLAGIWRLKKAQLHSDFKSGKITQKQLEDGLNKLAVGPSSKDKTAVARDRKEREEIFKAQKEADKSWQKQQPAGQKPEKKMSREDFDKAEFDQWFGGLTKEKQDAFREYVEDMKKSASGIWVDPNKKYAFSKQSEQPAKQKPEKKNSRTII